MNLSQTLPRPAEVPADAWINGPRWDLALLIGSAAVVPIVLFFVWQGLSSTLINLGVTAIVGGPHLFSTFTATYMDKRFRRAHLRALLVSAIVVPAFVVYWTLVDFQILLSVFIFAASVHVLHQNAYLTDIYRRKSGLPETTWSRFIDYGLLFVSMYPIASYKLVNSNFLLGETEILIPAFFKVPATYVAVALLFTVLFAAWIAKTLNEIQRGTLNVPKTLLIAFTCTIAFFVPAAASGERLELAFQAVNAWHSIQYLGIIWFVQKVRKERGLIDSGFISRMSGSGRPAIKFYSFCVGTTVVLFAGVLGIAQWDPANFSAQVSSEQAFQRYYYMGVLSCLLIHYVLDGLMFTVSNRPEADLESMPLAAPAQAQPEAAPEPAAVPAAASAGGPR